MKRLAVSLLASAALVGGAVWLSQDAGDPQYAFSFTLTWDANTEPDIAGYVLYLGEQSMNYVARIELPNITEQKVMNNHAVTYCAVAARNLAGLEGPKSDECIYTRHSL